MCLLIAFYKVFPDFPIIIGANREESYSRPSLPPQSINQIPKILAGKDKVAGGTWLGVNEFGLVAGITNRGKVKFNPSLRSRGLLCLDLLKEKTAGSADKYLETAIASSPYNSFNLFYADRDSAYMAVYENELLNHLLEPGIHVLVSQGLNGISDRKMKRISLLLESLPKEYSELFVSELINLLRDHDTELPDRQTICSHGETGGTVSSTILAIHQNFPENSGYLFADGPPCHTSFIDFSDLFTNKS